MVSQLVLIQYHAHVAKLAVISMALVDCVCSYITLWGYLQGLGIVIPFDSALHLFVTHGGDLCVRQLDYALSWAPISLLFFFPFVAYAVSNPLSLIN